MASAVTAPHGALSARAAVRGARATRRTVAPARRVNTTTRAAIVDPPKASIKDVKRPDETGRFGDYGGKYVPETLIPALQALEKEYAALASDEQFQVRTRTRDRHTRLSDAAASRLARARERRRATSRRASTRARSRRDRPYLSVEARFSQTEKTRR
jgi:hypothetical protein